MKMIPLPSSSRFTLSKLDGSRVSEYQSILFETIEELHHDSPWKEIVKRQYSKDILVEHISADCAFCPIILNEQNEIVGLGVGRHEGGLGTVSWIVVAPKFRRQGLGTLVLNSLTTSFREAGCHRVDLKTYLNTQWLQDFYERKGFEPAAFLPNHKFGFDIVYMVQDIPVQVKHLEDSRWLAAETN